MGCNMCLRCELSFINSIIASLQTQISELQGQISELTTATQSIQSITALSMVSTTSQGLSIGIVPFDTVRFDSTDGNITYDISTSTFAIAEAGSYVVLFDVVYDSGTLTDSDLVFGLFVGSSSVAIASEPVTTLSVDRLSAMEVIQIDSESTNVWIQCINVPEINLANTLVQANVVFIKIN